MAQQAIFRLLDIMMQLRNPKTGCEWDVAQTWETLIPYTLEETYEVTDAISSGDPQHVREELGDLLYHIVFYAQIAKERHLFDFNDICVSVSDKLVQRHPHVFSPETCAEKPNWEAQKLLQRNENAGSSILSDIPAVLPALMAAQKIQKRCAAVGFDWQNWPPVLDKVHEEIAEVVAEIEQTPVDKQKLEEEMGDLLFAVVNLARHCGVNAENALKRANQKFIRRFEQIEKSVQGKNQSLAALSLTQLDAEWNQVKKSEN